MRLVSEEINAYCANHSTLPSTLCQELETYTRTHVPRSQMVSGSQVGSFLGFLIAAIGARRVLEVGTYTGYSALAMAENLPTDGELITLDVNPETVAIAQKYWERSPHGRKIRAVVQPALETIQGLKGPFDLVFIDADKPNYLNYLKAVLSLLSPRGVVVADNTLWSGRVLDEEDRTPETHAIREFNDFCRDHEALQSTLVPIRDGLHLIRKK